MTRFVVLFAALFLPIAVAAQDRPNTILVLDGSGSMWGQIDGVNKIVIAREAVAGILRDFPDDQGLGLTVYGHRTEGDCTDIETVVAPDAGTSGAIIDAVNGINPRGKTPMTDAVTAAAEALDYLDAPATVVLVSDGIETCAPDPCAAARALEAAGAELTVHVVGFDVSDAEAIGQLQCLAEETGGVFLSASNASELTEALTQVAVAVPEPAPEPEPEPVLTPMTLEAVIGENGPRITDPVFWQITPAPEGFEAGAAANPLSLELAAGAYEVTGTWSVAEQTVTANISVLGATARVVSLIFEKPQPVATLIAPETAVAGSTVEIAWEGPGASNDFIVAGDPGKGTYATNTPVRDGNPAKLRAPSTPGSYELRYVLGQGSQILATRVLEVTPAEATLDAPETAIAGATVEIAWEGPGYQPDYIAVAEPGSKTQINHTLTREGSPLKLAMPVEPGTYELRYVMQTDRYVLATRPIEVTDVGATLAAPDTAVAGATVEVAWDGPDYQNDFIAVGEPDEDQSINYTYTRDGTPAALMMPVEPGDYEIRYVASQDRKVLATRPVIVTPVEARLVAPGTAAAGSDLEVAWEGPDYRNDYIAVAKPGEDGYEGYTYTREGSPLALRLPTDTGEYELRYVLAQDRTVIATQKIVLEAVGATLVAPDTATAGSEVEVSWEGPDYANDYIAVAAPDDDGYVNYTYTREGSPLDLTLPTEPGDYELRYVLAQDKTVLAARAIAVTGVSAEIAAPGSAVVGETIEVAWSGPDYRNDYVAVGEPGDSRYVNYSYTREGTPLKLRMPPEPGIYEIRYVMNQDGKVLDTTAIEVADLSVTLAAPDSAPAGTTLEVAHDGPEYQNDLITIAAVGADRYTSYVYANRGNPAKIAVPDVPGDYEIRYVMNQGNRVLQSRPLRVVKAE